MVLSSRTATPQGTVGVGLEWQNLENRWGKWKDDCVMVVAPCVAEFEVVSEGGQKATIQQVQQVLQQMPAELPKDCQCINLSSGTPNDHSFRLRAALLCTIEMSESLKQTWQRKNLRIGSFVATLVGIFDTISAEHNASVSSRAAKHSKAETGLVLELPTHWVKRAVPEGEDSARLRQGSHWHGFCSLFGEAVSVDLVRGPDPNRMHVLANFSLPEGAQAMFEALTDRFLYNPVNTQVDDTHPAVCVIGQIEDLQRALRGEAGFILRRVGATAEKKAGPAAIQVNLTRQRLVIGREEDCDVMLRRAHVSKHHATIAMIRNSSQRWILTIRDTSANGTWVNGKRLRPNVVTELHTGDQLTFLPAAHMFYKDALMYEVASSSDWTDATTRQRNSENGHAATQRDASSKQLTSAQTAARKRGSDTLSSSLVGESATGSSQRDRVRRRTNRSSRLGAQSANVHLARPVAVDVDDIGVVAEDGVVEVDGAASSSSPSEVEAPVPTRLYPPGEDISDWIRGLDGGSLVEYESILVSLFDSVSQIRDLYHADRLQDFYADIGVKEVDHQLAFATALNRLRASRP